MIKLKTKQQLRQELEAEMNLYLDKGGTIQHIAQGESGKILGENLNHRVPFSPEKQTRTPLTEEIQALENRKNTATKIEKVNRSSQPRKKIIYDDFGEPIREVWE